MAVEAARQLSFSRGIKDAMLVVSDVHFENTLALSNFADLGTIDEMQSVAKTTPGTECLFDFEVFVEPATGQRGWTRLCSGTMGWNQDSKQSSVGFTDAMVHDQALLDIAKGSDCNMTFGVDNVMMNDRGCRGTFGGIPDKHEKYQIDPVNLGTILDLAPFSLSRRNLPTVSRISHITSVSVPAHCRESQDGSFTSVVRPYGHYGSECNLEIRQSEGSIMLKGV